MIEVDTGPQGQQEREVWRERARPFAHGVADSGKHANSFSYACEKVQEPPYAQKGKARGEGQPDSFSRLGGFKGRGYNSVQLRIHFIW